MRDAFPEFYHPTADDERRFITDGTVVVDANVLLALYELSAVQRDETLIVLEKIGSRLWIPYQVGLEYQRNRLGVIRKQAAHYTHLVDLHGVRDLDGLSAALSKITVPDEVADEVRLLLKQLASKLTVATTDYVKAANEIRDRHVVSAEQGVIDDPVRKRLDVLFADRVGQRPADQTNESRVSEATRRRKERIPPGYKDENKETDERSAGDYLLWAELLNHAQETASDGRPFLLVTNDVKEDWYAKSGGEPTGPRPELVREFNAYNPNGYHQVTLEGMLRLARSYLAVDIDDATIEKASELSRPELFYIDESTGQPVVAEVERYSGGSPQDLIERRRMRSRLIDRLLTQMVGVSAEESPQDFEVIKRHLTRALTNEVAEVGRSTRLRSWSDKDLRVVAHHALSDVLESMLGRPIPLEGFDSLTLDLFVDLVRKY